MHDAGSWCASHAWIQDTRRIFCENALVRKIAHGAALICSVCGVRVAISAALAERIFVREVGV
jgi:hypothetical protein